MQGKSRIDRELLDAGELARHLVPSGSVFVFLAEHCRELFPDSFPDRAAVASGGPGGSVLVLKELYDLSDPQTPDALSYDIRWKVACGRSLDQMSFDPSTPVYWRRRIAASDRPDRVFDAVAGVIAQTGILRGGASGAWTRRCSMTRPRHGHPAGRRRAEMAPVPEFGLPRQFGPDHLHRDQPPPG